MRLQVRLYCEQEAVVVVDAPAGLSTPRESLRELALAELDCSNGAEWRTIAGWIDSVREVDMS